MTDDQIKSTFYKKKDFKREQTFQEAIFLQSFAENLTEERTITGDMHIKNTYICTYVEQRRDQTWMKHTNAYLHI